MGMCTHAIRACNGIDRHDVRARARSEWRASAKRDFLFRSGESTSCSLCAMVRATSCSPSSSCSMLEFSDSADELRCRLVLERRGRSRLHVVQRWHLPRQQRHDSVRRVHRRRLLHHRRRCVNPLCRGHLLGGHGQLGARRLRRLPCRLVLRNGLDGAFKLRHGNVHRRRQRCIVHVLRRWHFPRC